MSAGPAAPDVLIRPMRSADEAEVRAMMRELFRGEPPPDLAGMVLVAETAEGARAGFLWLALRPWAEGCDGAPVPYVEGWFVRDGLRGRGVGRALMGAAEDWARCRGFREIGSDAEIDNAGSMAAHGRVGFVRTVRLQFFRKALDPAGTSASVAGPAAPGDRTSGGSRPAGTRP